jgi:hypothetical protein
MSSAVSIDGYVEGGAIGAGQWRLVSVPLSDLGGASQVIAGIVIQDQLGQPQSTVYLDDLQLVIVRTK